MLYRTVIYICWHYLDCIDAFYPLEERPTLDHIDLQILRSLQEDCRVTFKELAAKLELTATPVFERVKKLEKQGLIKGHVALLDHVALGFSLMAFVEISLRDHRREAIEQFVLQITSHREVMECYHVTGESDFLLKLLLVDMDAYNRFVLDKLSTVENIGKVVTRFAISVRKASHQLPLS